MVRVQDDSCIQWLYARPKERLQGGKEIGIGKRKLKSKSKM